MALKKKRAKYFLAQKSQVMKFIKYLLIVLLFPTIVFAQELQANFQDWNVFKVDRGDKVICYMASIPIKQIGANNRRGEPFFLVTDIQNEADEVSTALGFFYKENSNVEISFGSKKFYLFPYKSLAWANDTNDDIDIIKEMQKSDDMIVSGIAKDGKIAHDTYSLIGFTKGYLKMNQICKDLR